MKSSQTFLIHILNLVLFGLSSLLCFSAMAMTIGSKDIAPNSKIGSEFVYGGMGCGGKDVSPELHWSGAPKDTKSFAVTVYDPDAPTGSGFWHWVVYNIPVKTISFNKGWKALSGEGTAIVNDFGSPQYDGPCPPPGKPHRYIFTVHALKVEKLDLPVGATNAFARFNIEGNSIDKASFVATYGR